MNKRMLLAAICMVTCATVISAATMKQIRLTEGHEGDNAITAPVYDNSGLPSVEIAMTASYDRKPNFVRRTGGRLPATRGPEYDLDPKVDLTALLTEALHNEALAMGLTRAGASGPAWHVTGTLKDIYLESRQVYMGATLFYGYMDVDLQIKNPAGESQAKRLSLHNYYGGYNAGFGRKDEAESGAAHLLVEGAQEILARLNHDIFKAPPHRDMSAKIERLQASGVKGHLGDLRMVSLSGLPAAVPTLLAMVPKEKDENLRSATIDALAQLGSSDAVAVLSGRYATEDEDCRWYTLKAMDYIGGPEAERLVNTLGLRDKDTGPKRLAARIARKPAP
jgi:hypothetical protein